jgi:hypothetical protein
MGWGMGRLRSVVGAARVVGAMAASQGLRLGDVGCQPGNRGGGWCVRWARPDVGGSLPAMGVGGEVIGLPRPGVSKRVWASIAPACLAGAVVPMSFRRTSLASVL